MVLTVALLQLVTGNQLVRLVLAPSAPSSRPATRGRRTG
jgi:hypothetical protein